MSQAILACKNPFLIKNEIQLGNAGPSSVSGSHDLEAPNFQEG